MKKELIKSILVFFLLGATLTGCQEKADTPVQKTETTAADSNSESTEPDNHDHGHSHEDDKQKEI